MEIVPLSVTGTGASHTVGLPYNRRNVEEWSRLDSITGMMEKAKIETDRWSASNSAGKHNFAKVVDSRERNRPDGSLQQKERKQMEMFQTRVPGGSMQVIRTQTVTSSSSSSWSAGKAFGELQLPVNHLDLSSQKMKGSVGRSGSMGNRRPPSRPRSLGIKTSDAFAELTAECHRMHEEAKARIFGNFSNGFMSDHEEPDDSGGVVITEIESPSETSSQKTNFSRQKSCSNENINDESSFERSSQMRRSLQIPKTTITDDIPDWTNGKSLKERAAEIENLLRRGTTSVSLEKREPEKCEVIPNPVKVNSSFVTAETLQEVRDRLRKSSNSDTDAKDDGIVPDSVCVKDLLSGFEEKLGSLRLNGTGSLASRNNKSVSSDWIRRRKSYGFEKVDSEIYSNGESSADSGLGNSSETKPPLRRYPNEPLSEAEAAFTRKSPLPSRERALRCNKNPWLSQLRGTKLLDRDWPRGTPEPEGLSDSPKSNDENLDSSQKKQKKVEFCKTEVHFAAEPGKFHIVETDGKPPSSAAVRRSRRKSGRSSPPNNPLALPEMKFGDSLVEKEQLIANVEKIDSLSKRIESELKELTKIEETLPRKEETPVAIKPPTKLYDLQEEQGDDPPKPRSIFKTDQPVWKSTVILKSKIFDDVKKNEAKSYSSDGESELQIRFRHLRRVEEPTDKKSEPISIEVKRRSLPEEVLLKNNRLTTTIDLQPTVLSVAERIKQVEQKTNYSSKIDFRSGEVTVLQNGTAEKKPEYPTWPEFCDKKISSDPKAISNPSVKRQPTKETNTTTTRISINIPCETKSPLTTKTTKAAARSWSFGTGSQRFEKPQSASLVMKTIQDREVLKNSKPVHEIISKFDSLTKPQNREQRRRTMPINYKAPKEYTHSDLEEELRSFTEDLDKDFRDIYEQEIGSLKGSCRDLTKIFEEAVKESESQSDVKARTLPLAKSVRMKNTKKIPVEKPYESDDSDLLADEEVRSYMSAGQVESESDFESQKKKSFEKIRLQFKRLEHLETSKKKVSDFTAKHPVKPTFVDLRASEPYYAAPPKVASIALRYEDDPSFNQPSKVSSDRWEKVSNSSSDSRTRVSYLNGPSLSEKYSKTNSSLDNLFEGSALQRVKEIQENLRNSFRSSHTSGFREVTKENSSDKGVQLTLDELSRAADDMVVAANGLTDDSVISSSEDEGRNIKVLKKGAVRHLGTISEGLKANTADSRKLGKDKSLSSRATRLMQRASHREAAIAQRSSSEDLPNIEPVKKKITRRPRMASVKNDETVKVCPRVKARPEKEVNSIPRERAKTVSSAAKEVVKTRSSQLSSNRIERTKTSERRELLAKADVVAQQSIKSKRNSYVQSSTYSRSDPNRESLTKRKAKVSLRKVEAARVSQAV